METGLIFGVAIAVAIAVAAWGYYAKLRRRDELASMARQLGLSYTTEDTRGCLGYPFALLRRGDGRGTENVLSGTWNGVDLVGFDYWYYTESTDSNGHRTKSYSRFSCAVTQIDAAMAPLTIGRENILTRIADAVGLDDIGFETQEFNDAFNVKSKDRRFANDLIDQRMMAWLLSTASDFSFEASGRWLLCYSRRRRPTELVPLLGTLKEFRDQVPRVVYDLYRVAPGHDPFDRPPPTPGS